MPNQFDDLAEQLIEAALARVLGRQLDAGDVMRALVRALADARGSSTPPNHVWVSLNALDLRTLIAAEPGLADALAEQTGQIMVQMGLRTPSAPRVLLQGLTHLAPGQLRVTARWLPLAGDREQAAIPGARANLFGMTESFGPYCGDRLDVDMPPSKWGSCGRPFDGIDVRVADAYRALLETFTKAT